MGWFWSDKKAKRSERVSFSEMISEVVDRNPLLMPPVKPPKPEHADLWQQCVVAAVAASADHKLKASVIAGRACEIADQVVDRKKDRLEYQAAKPGSETAKNTGKTVETKAEIADLVDILVCITHGGEPISFYKKRWLPIVQKELRRRAQEALGETGPGIQEVYDFYYSEKQDKKWRKECAKAFNPEKHVSWYFKGKLFTQSVAIGEEPPKGFNDFVLIGTGFRSDQISRIDPPGPKERDS